MLNYLYAKMRCNNKITALVFLPVIICSFLQFCISFRKKNVLICLFSVSGKTGGHRVTSQVNYKKNGKIK